MKDFLEKIDNNKKLLYSALVIILIGALFLRFYKLEKTFSDYDDIGVLALYKIPSGEKEFTVLKNDYLNISGKVDLKKLSDQMLDSPIYPVFMGKVWTYPPGQYIFYPPLISESESPDTKIWKGRSVSAFFSFVSVILLIYFLYLINDKKLDWKVLLASLPLAYSFNNVIYSHHMSPYSLNVTTLIFSLICFHYLIDKKIKHYHFGIILGLLSYFNYLILLTIPVFGIIMLKKQKEDFKNLKTVISNIVIPAFCYIILFLPGVVLFLKSGRGMHGKNFSFQEEGILGLLTYFPKKILLITNSNMAFITTNEVINTILSILLFTLFILLLYKLVKKKSEMRWPLVFAILFVTEWCILNLMGRIVLLDSRHLLIWTPLMCVVLYFILNEYSKQNIFAVLIIAFLVPSVFSNIKNIDSKKNNFNRAVIEQDTADVILTYGGTLGPMLYFENSKTVYNVDFKTFAETYKSIKLPERMLLTSTDMSFDEYQETSFFNEVKGLFDQYNIRLIKKLISDINLLYNNKGFSGGKNHFYLYELNKKTK